MTYLAVFDWNATLFNDVTATYEATNHCLEFFGKPPMSLEQQQEAFTFPLIHFYEKAGVSSNDYLSHIDEMERRFHSTYDRFKLECSLMEGTIEVLEWLRAHNVTCKILSNYNQKDLEADATRLGVADYFETISGNFDPATVVSSTNKYERLKAFMDESGYSPDKTFIIGDSHEEPDLARKLGILGISITGGLLSSDRLEKYKKDYVIDSLRELPAILSREWGLEHGEGLP